MNVQQLIDALSKMNKEAEVLMPDGLPVIGVENHENYIYLVDVSEELEEQFEKDYQRQIEEENFLMDEVVEY